MYRKISLSIVILLSISVLTGCGKKKDENLIARVNGKKILASEFEEKLTQMPVYFQQNNTQRRKFLDNLIDREILLAEAKKRRLAQQGTVKERLERALEQILVEELIKTAIPEVSINEDDLRNYYAQNKTQFIEQEKVKVSQILVRSEKEAGELLKQLKGGKDFAGLARAKSISPDANSGGDIGYFGRGEMLPEFEGAAFDLAEGKISRVIKTPFGYHILKVTGKQEKRQKAFPEAKEEIEAILRQKKQRQNLDDWFKDLKQKANIKVNEDFFAQPPAESPVETVGKEETK